MPVAQFKPLNECWLIDQTTPNKGECHLTNDNDNGTIIMPESLNQELLH